MQAQNILGAFAPFQMAPIPGDQFATTGRALLAQKMESFMAKGEPLRFVMLGYPMKSPNERDKVLGRLPDGAEEASFEQVRAFNDAVREHYAPGIELTMVSDGYIFNDIMEVPDGTVEEYGEAVRDMSRGLPIRWLDVRDFYSRHTDLKALRERVTLQHGITAEELERRILFDADVNELYRGMIRFMTLDLAVKNFPSNSQLQKHAKRLAREMMFRNEAYSQLVAGEMAGHIRLSIHPSINSGRKYSFQLIPGAQARHSPWHACLAIGAELMTVHRRDAEAQGLELVYREGRPWNYVTTNEIKSA